MRRILLGYDGSEVADHALEQACRLASLYRCPLTILTAAKDRLVREDGVVTPAVDEEAARATAERAARTARERGVSQVETRVSVDAPDDALVLEAKNGYDLLVVGHRGLGAVEEFFLGSTAKAVVDRAPCSVLVVR